MTDRDSRGRALCTTCQGFGSVVDLESFDVVECPECVPPPESWQETAMLLFGMLVIAAVVLLAVIR